MSERIKVDHESPAIHFAIEAIAKSAKKDIPGLGAGYVDVSLILNGVELPFASTIKTVYDLFEKQIDERAAEIACKSATLKGLDGLRDAIETARSQIKERIEAAFGVELPEE